MFCSEYQFVYPAPKGSELIISAPFRGGVFRDNQFADWVYNRTSIKKRLAAELSICVKQVYWFLGSRAVRIAEGWAPAVSAMARMVISGAA